MPFFKTTDPAAVLQALTAKLDAARTRLAVAEERLASEAVAIALSEDPEAAARDPRAAVEAARGQVALLEQAVEQADAAERQRQARAAAEAQAARMRALRQRLGEKIRASAEFEHAIGSAVEAWDRMVELSAICADLWPRNDPGVEVIGLRHLGECCRMEMQRFAPYPGISSKPQKPGVPGWPGWPHAGEISVTPISEVMRRDLLNAYSRLVGTSPSPALDPADDEDAP